MTTPPGHVWVFQGEKARHASGVFASKGDALAWAGRHRLTGILTEYPVGIGVYDDAIAHNRFKPTRSHHGTPEHIAGFSPSAAVYEHIHLVDGRDDLDPA